MHTDDRRELVLLLDSCLWTKEKYPALYKKLKSGVLRSYETITHSRLGAQM